jgi:hypothetical protein
MCKRAVTPPQSRHTCSMPGLPCRLYAGTIALEYYYMNIIDAKWLAPLWYRPRVAELLH